MEWSELSGRVKTMNDQREEVERELNRLRQLIEDDDPAVTRMVEDGLEREKSRREVPPPSGGRFKRWLRSITGRSEPFVRDPQESDPVLGPIIEEVLRREAGPTSIQRQLGYCHVVWRRAKDRLRSEHGIEWQSPADLNPDCRFD